MGRFCFAIYVAYDACAFFADYMGSSSICALNVLLKFWKPTCVIFCTIYYEHFLSYLYDLITVIIWSLAGDNATTFENVDYL